MAEWSCSDVVDDDGDACCEHVAEAEQKEQGGFQVLLHSTNFTMARAMAEMTSLAVRSRATIFMMSPSVCCNNV